MRILTLFTLFFFQACSGVFYQPSRQQFTDPAQFKLKYHDVWFDSSDGTKLHGWFLPSRTKKVKGTIVQFHGNAENISTHYFSLIWLLNEGYNLFTWDYRGYGKSEGKPSQEGIYHDSLAAMNKGRELHQNQGLFVIYGQSLGGAISMRAMTDFQQANEVDLLVHDSSFTSYQAVGSKVLQSRWFLWPFSPLAYVLVSDKYAAEKVLDKITTPTLVIVGKKDSIVPAVLGKETYIKIKSNRKWIWEIPEGRHIDVYHIAEGRYRREFTALLDQMASN